MLSYLTVPIEINKKEHAHILCLWSDDVHITYINGRDRYCLCGYSLKNHYNQSYSPFKLFSRAYNAYNERYTYRKIYYL